MRISLSFLLIVLIGGVQAQNIQLRSTTTYSSDMSDVWGYSDGEREYALATYEDGWSVVDVTDPDLPVKLFNIPGINTYWRDIKTFGQYAYGIHENEGPGNEGLIIMDLSQLPNALPVTYWNSDGTPGINFRAAHNIFIDEKGVAYISGHNMPSGGVLMLDVATDPLNPAYLGQYTEHYVHDCFARNDTLWTAEVGVGQFSVIDVTTKSDPVVLAEQTTPMEFTHNIWLSDDGATAFTTDERTGAFLAAYDVRDLDDIRELDRYQSSLSVIPHNATVKDEFVVVSWYSHGVIILDATFPDELVEVGRYDTAPNYPGPGFHGAWGVYPYLPSGNLLVTDIEEGLVVLTPEYRNATHIRGQVINAGTLQSIQGVSVRITSTQGTFAMNSNLSGRFKKGLTYGGDFTLVFSKTGYEDQTIELDLDEGEIADLIVEMQPLSYTPTDTIYLSIAAGGTEMICADETDGLDADAVFICGGAQASALGEWVAFSSGNTGCLEYTAFTSSGDNTDEVCLVVLDENSEEVQVSLVVVDILMPTGIASNGFENGLWRLAGNPARDAIRLLRTGATEPPADVRIYDSRGRLAGIETGISGTSRSIPVSALAPGLYILTVSIENQVVGSTKFIKE